MPISRRPIGIIAGLGFDKPDLMPTLSIIARAWCINPAGLAVCAALLMIYLWAGTFSPSRVAFFLVTEIFLIGVFCSPLDVVAREYLFTAEAIERVLIVFIASYLFLLALPPKISVRVNRYVAFAAGLGILSIWFLPALLNHALANETVRGVEYATLFIAGAIFWWPLHAPSLDSRMPLMPASLIYLATATVWCSILGLFLAFAQPFYNSHGDSLHIYQSLIDDWSFTRKNDQQTGGLLFWIFAASVLLSEVMAVYVRWYRKNLK